jgi:hypothetical protein
MMSEVNPFLSSLALFLLSLSLSPLPVVAQTNLPLRPPTYLPANSFYFASSLLPLLLLLQQQQQQQQL